MNTTNNNTNNANTNEDLSFLEESNSGGMQFKDILVLVFRNLPWFLLCALLGGGIAYYMVKSQDRIYSSSTSILLKTGSSGGSESFRSSALMNQVAGNTGVAVSSIHNEIIIIKSQTLMENVVRRLNLNTDYSYTTRLAKRNKVLYKDSPVEVLFPDANEQLNASLTVTPVDNSHVELSLFNGREDVPSKTVRVGDTVSTPVGRVVVRYTWYYNEGFNSIPIIVKHYSVAAVAARYRNAVNVVRDDEKNTILRLSLADTSPTRAADVLNTLVEVYNEDSMEDQKRILAYSTKYIDDRITYLDSDIDSISQQVVSFQQRHNIIDLGSYGQSFVASSAEYSQELKDLEIQRGLAEYLLDFVKQNTDHDLIPSNMGLQGKAASLIDKYDEIALQLNKYKQSGTMNNPQAQAKMTELITLEVSVKESLASYLAELETRIRSASQGRQSANAQVQSVPVEQLRVRAIESKKQIKEGLLLTMLTKREELLLNEPKIEPSCKVIDQAWANYSAIAPKPKKAVMRGVLLGLLVPVLVIVLRRLLDTRVHYRGDVERLTKTPFLGEIPLKKDAGEHAIVVKENGRDSVSEAFRLVRSNLEYMKNQDRKGGQVVMFTSFIVGSGKTFVSSNLSASFAHAKKKVVLVDLDIRKATMNKVFGMKAGVGVSNYLSGTVDSVDELIHTDLTTENMDVIFSGPVPPNPAELLMSERLDHMVDYLRERYDYVFLDNVPVGIVADPEIVRRLADVTLFVVRANKTDKRLVSELDKIYRSERFPNLSVVLNSVIYKKHGGYGYGGYGGYGYGYGYGYGSYGYGYGYGSDEDEDGKKK